MTHPIENGGDSGDLAALQDRRRKKGFYSDAIWDRLRATSTVKALPLLFQPALDALASVLFAAPCRICEQPLLNASRIPICESCLASFEAIGEGVCACCGRPEPPGIAESGVAPTDGADKVPVSFAGGMAGVAAGADGRWVCRLCRAQTFGFARARSWAAYNPSLTSAIMLLKYEEVTRLGDWFAARLAELYAGLLRSDAEGWGAAIIVPVPLHSERRAERGYNQVDMIARPLAKRLGLKMRADLLLRTKPRPPRLVLSRSEHWESVRGAYAIREGAKIENVRVLLLDDVMTTGATLDACSRVLRKAGAAEVMALTVARAIPKWLAN